MKSETARQNVLFGIFLTSFCLLTYEITLTRIFSVAMWFHFAFLAVSLALLGMGASGIFVHFLTPKMQEDDFLNTLCFFSFLFSISMTASCVIFLIVPFIPQPSLFGVISVMMICLSAATPFFLGGACLSLCFYFLRENISRLYFSDLFGGSMGCLWIVVFLHLLRASTVIVVLSCIACIGTFLFSSLKPHRFFRALSILAFLFFLFFAFLDARAHFLRVSFSKGAVEGKNIYEKWNSFSRVVVSPQDKRRPYAWGLSETFKNTFPPYLLIRIDLSAVTPLIQFHGRLKDVDYLKYDIPSLVYSVKKANDIFIIGPGGGKDVLAGLLFNVRDIYGAELNPIIVNIVNKKFAYFTQSLYTRANVHIQVNDGRSALSQMKRQFDIVQASLVDTQAATAAGAYVLSENNLYTVEAFEEYFKHLKSSGILTMTRSYYNHLPAESLRLAALGVAALKKLGAKRIHEHFLIAKVKAIETPSGGPDSYAVFLIKKTPFTKEETRRFEKAVSRLHFDLVYSSFSKSQKEFDELLKTQNLTSFCTSYPLNICPPTDEKPFFFYALRLKDLPGIFLHRRATVQQGATQYNITAIFVLGLILCVVAFFAFFSMVFPLILNLLLRQNKTSIPYGFLFYFACLGLAFMLVEVPLIQKFTLFLGYPVYSLSVILFSLLLFSGIGSFSTHHVSPVHAKNKLLKMIPCLLLMLVVCTLFSTFGIYSFMDKPRLVKCFLTVLFLAPMGFFMGMPFPLGIKMLSQRAPEAIPWAWAMNGIFSVCASVFSIVVSLNWGITHAVFLGGLAYVFALFAAAVSERAREF